MGSSRVPFAHMLAYWVLALLLASCHPTDPTGRQGRVWVFAQADGNDLQIDVHLEAADGQVPGGARVWLTDPGGGLRLVSFDTRSQSYRFEGRALKGTWLVEIDSLAAGRLNLNVPVNPLSGSPEVVSVQDGAGHRAESYEQLVASTPIRVEWRTVPDADEYLLEVLVSGVVIYSVQVGDVFAIIPGNTISASEEGTRVSLRVTASSSSGDLRFSQGYYSVCSSESRIFSFEAVP